MTGDLMSYVYGLRNELNRRGVILSLNGPISYELIVGMGDALKRKLQIEEAERATILKVFGVVVELAENILHYSAEPVAGESDKMKQGIIVVGREIDHYYVICGNMIKHENVDGLRRKLTLIRDMDKDELKSYYRDQRKKEPEKESKGAGLGLIEMARKSSRPIDFEFKQISADMSFFYLRTVI